MRIQAQLSAATAADQRALTLAGFQIASASAALAGGGALIVSDKPNAPLAYLAMAFAFAMILTATFSIRTVRPSMYHMPGNKPGGWLPDSWMGAGLHPPTLKQARIEQAACLDEAISDNAESAKRAAKWVHRSMDFTLWAVGGAALAMLLILLAENRTHDCLSPTLPYKWMPACIQRQTSNPPPPVPQQNIFNVILGSTDSFPTASSAKMQSNHPPAIQSRHRPAPDSRLNHS